MFWQSKAQGDRRQKTGARIAALSLALALAGCSQPASDSQLKVAAPKTSSSAEVKKYELHGEVLEVDAQGHIAKIKHGKIGDWMEAMTMEFPVKDPADFAKLKVGEKVSATVFVQDINFWVGDVKVDAAK